MILKSPFGWAIGQIYKKKKKKKKKKIIFKKHLEKNEENLLNSNWLSNLKECQPNLLLHFKLLNEKIQNGINFIKNSFLFFFFFLKNVIKLSWIFFFFFVKKKLDKAMEASNIFLFKSYNSIFMLDFFYCINFNGYCYDYYYDIP